MKVLWFSVTPSLFNPHSNSHNGGGWIASLEQIVRREPMIELGVAFHFGSENKRYDTDGVSYYTIAGDTRNAIAKLLTPHKPDHNVARYLEIIEDFKPDVIQIFGSENDFGLITAHTKVPVVIHMQGSLPPYHNALFPQAMNTWDFVVGKGLTLQRRLMGLRSDKAFKKNASREEGIIAQCPNFMGRTEWDKNIVHTFNPNARYFHCEEALRDSFFSNGKNWLFPDGKELRLISVISTPWYKGVDVILKTAQLLKLQLGDNFRWDIYGTRDIRFFEHKYGINAKDVNVNVCGTASKEQLVEALCSSHCYIHPSYIDNSPNSLCEAQILGVPVIASYVGGIPSLVKHGETGMLFPANDPFTLAALVQQVCSDKSIAVHLSDAGKTVATRRHDSQAIGNRLFEIYQTIIKEHQAK